MKGKFGMSDLLEWVRDMGDLHGYREGCGSYEIIRDDGSIIEPPDLPGDDETWEIALSEFDQP